MKIKRSTFSWSRGFTEVDVLARAEGESTEAANRRARETASILAADRSAVGLTRRGNTAIALIFVAVAIWYISVFAAYLLGWIRD